MTEPPSLSESAVAWCAAARFRLVLEHVLPYLDGTAAREAAYTLASFELDTPEQRALLAEAEAEADRVAASLDAWYDTHPAEPLTAEELLVAEGQRQRVNDRVAELIEDGQRRRRTWESASISGYRSRT